MKQFENQDFFFFWRNNLVSAIAHLLSAMTSISLTHAVYKYLLKTDDVP